LGSSRAIGKVMIQLQDEAARSLFIEKAQYSFQFLGLDTESIYILSPIFPILAPG